jgi:predicted nucleotide-binding protein
MRDTELVRKLIKEAEDLPELDESALDALRRRSEMIIRRVFGDSSNYLGDLKDIQFFTPYTDFSHQAWRSGKQKILNLFKTMLEELELFGASKDVNDTDFSNQIFVVHGHDGAMKQEVARTLERLELNPIILHEQPNAGLTIIEKLEKYSNVSAFAVILLSPDDFGFSKDQSSENAKPRSRQNVVFELGFFIGKLGRDRVTALYKKVEIFDQPSDYDGVIYIPFDENEGWKMRLVKELNACGFNVDANKLAK